MWRPSGLLLLAGWLAALLWSELRALFSQPVARSPAPLDADSTCIVTGASSGIGLAVAEQLALRGWRVVLTCRTLDRACTAAASLRQRHPGAELLLEPAGLELSSAASVAQGMRALRAALRGQRLMLLRGGRIVVVGSFTHRAAGLTGGPGHFSSWASTGLQQFETIDAGSSSPSTVFGPAESYTLSKLGITLLCNGGWSVPARGAGVSCVTADPGLVDTAISRDWPMLLRAAYTGPMRTLGILRPASCGADAVLAAVDADVASGAYIYGPRGVSLPPGGRLRPCQAAGEALWARIQALAADALPPE